MTLLREIARDLGLDRATIRAALTGLAFITILAALYLVVRDVITHGIGS